MFNINIHMEGDRVILERLNKFSQELPKGDTSIQKSKEKAGLK